MCGTKKIILYRDRDRDQKKNFTGTRTGTEKKNYRDQRLNPRLHDGLNSVIFCASEVTLFEKKEPKSASRRLNKLKKRILKNFLDEILNYRSAGPLSVPVPVTVIGTRTGTKREILAGPEPGPNKNYRDQKSWSRTSLVRE
jgi:hypothetical protein